LAGQEGDGFITNEIDVDKIKNKLLPAVKMELKWQEKNLDP
jgi:hypothetical protein